MITIQVFSASSSSTVKGAKVNVWIPNAGPYTEYTDSSGEAHFSKIDAGDYEYSVDSKQFKGRLEGRKIVYI